MSVFQKLVQNITVNIVGNQSCVATGGAPHQVTMKIVNNSGHDIELDPAHRCQCDKRHVGFYAIHGKFNNELPASLLRDQYQTTIRVSGREASPICPQGWIRYRFCTDPSIKFCIDFNAAGWTDLQNRSFVSAVVRNGNNRYGVEVEALAGGWSYIITLAPIEFAPNTAASGGLHAEDRILGGIAGLITSAGNGQPDHPEDMIGSTRNIEAENAPQFPCVLNTTALRYAISSVKTNGYSCGGVALQRVWWLLVGKCTSANAIKVGRASRMITPDAGACIASDLIEYCDNDGFVAGHVTQWSETHQKFREGRIILAVLNSVHWVTVIGIHNKLVYVIDYNGLVSVPEQVFAANVKAPSGIFANGALVWVGLR